MLIGVGWSQMAKDCETYVYLRAQPSMHNKFEKKKKDLSRKSLFHSQDP